MSKNNLEAHSLEWWRAYSEELKVILQSEALLNTSLNKELSQLKDKNKELENVVSDLLKNEHSMIVMDYISQGIDLHYQNKIKSLKECLRDMKEVVGFYGNPEMWMTKNNNGWIQTSPKTHGDNELIQNYKHPKTDWAGSIQVGGKRARAALEKHKEILEGLK